MGGGQRTEGEGLAGLAHLGHPIRALGRGGAGHEKRVGVGLGLGVRRLRGGEGGLPAIKSGQSGRAGFIRRAAWGVAAAAARAGGWLRP